MSNIKFIIVVYTILSLISCDSREKQNSPANSRAKVDFSNDWQSRVNKGKQVFSVNCKKCHTTPDKGQNDGMSWIGLFERAPTGEKFVIDFICSSSTLRNELDNYAISIKQEYNNTEYEHEFCNSLDKEEFKNIMVYLKQEIQNK